MSDCKSVSSIVFDMEGDLTEMDTALKAMFHALEKFGMPDAAGASGDLDHDVAYALSSKLSDDFQKLQEKWKRLAQLVGLRMD